MVSSFRSVGRGAYQQFARIECGFDFLVHGHLIGTAPHDRALRSGGQRTLELAAGIADDLRRPQDVAAGIDVELQLRA